MYVTYERVYLRLLQGLRSAVVDNIRWRIVGVMFPHSIFEDRCVDFRRSMIDVSTFKGRYVALRRSCVALRRSMSRCVDLRRSMCQLSKIDVSTFGDGCVDLRRPMIDVSTFEDRWLMCRPSKIDSRCVDLRTSIVDVKLSCYTCSKYWYYSCMRITPRVCTSVLSYYIAQANVWYNGAMSWRQGKILCTSSKSRYISCYPVQWDVC